MHLLPMQPWNAARMLPHLQRRALVSLRSVATAAEGAAASPSRVVSSTGRETVSVTQGGSYTGAHCLRGLTTAQSGVIRCECVRPRYIAAATQTTPPTTMSAIAVRSGSVAGCATRARVASSCPRASPIASSACRTEHATQQQQQQQCSDAGPSRRALGLATLGLGGVLAGLAPGAASASALQDFARDVLRPKTVLPIDAVVSLMDARSVLREIAVRTAVCMHAVRCALHGARAWTQAHLLGAHARARRHVTRPCPSCRRASCARRRLPPRPSTRACASSHASCGPRLPRP
jgi:hypothetical protein